MGEGGSLGDGWNTAQSRQVTGWHRKTEKIRKTPEKKKRWARDWVNIGDKVFFPPFALKFSGCAGDKRDKKG